MGVMESTKILELSNRPGNAPGTGTDDTNSLITRGMSGYEVKK
jgi:hypothetical protein